MDISIRQTTVIPTLMHWRKIVLRNVFGEEPPKAILLANRRYYIEHIADRTHIAIIATVDGTDAGCGGICLTEELPSPDNPSGRCAYLMNIFVAEEYRRRGIGGVIVRWLVDKARQSGCDKIYLETTKEGKPVYEKAGFRELPGIMKYEDTEDSKS